ncbi:hypothetical protein Bca4012_058979 [Brassica carinata]
MSKTLIPHGRFFLRRFDRRSYSSKPEIDLDSSSSATSKAEAERKSLNEYFQKMAVKNSTPDWLPFAPGSSFWVPLQHQKTAGKVAYMMNMVTNPLKKEEAFSLSSSSGWPCSSFFIPPYDEKVERSMELNIPGELGHFLNPIYSFKHVDDDEE